MRWLILAGLAAALLAGSARAQDNPVICGPYAKKWSQVGGGRDLRAIEAADRSIPSLCPQLRGQADRRMSELRRQEAAARPAPAPPRRPAPPKEDTGSQDETLASAPASPDVEAFPPCSPEAIAAKDPSLPEDASGVRLSPDRREDLARRFVRRGDAFAQCSQDEGAAEAYAAAIAADPQSFEAVVARARFHLDHGDDASAAADYATAIGLGDRAGADAVILAHDGRARAYEAMKRYADEAQDLQAVIDGFNHGVGGDTRSALASLDSYKERLGKAQHLAGEDPAAIRTFNTTMHDALDWQDLWFLGDVQARAGSWAPAISLYQEALSKAPAGPGLAPQRSRLELALGQAHLQAGEIRSAWDSFQAARSEDADDHDADAALKSLGPMPQPPTFEPPTLEPVPLPPGAADLANPSPPTFCGRQESFDYLDQIRQAVAVLNEDIGKLNHYSETLQNMLKQYQSSKLLTYAEMNEYSEVINKEWNRQADQGAQLHKQNDELLSLDNRVRSDPSLIGDCKR